MGADAAFRISVLRAKVNRNRREYDSGEARDLSGLLLELLDLLEEVLP